MESRNIRKKVKKPLQSFKDKRGSIIDIFYKKKIDHVAIIDSKPNALRGNHYHKKTIQHMLITEGSLEYWYKPLKKKTKVKKKILKVGDLVSTPPYEIHALKISKQGNQFIVFSEGLRGGKDYEADTFRVPSIIND
jgi:dTDP-4-dehydrorhamnose 3,5-epimerase-like enzyme